VRRIREVVKHRLFKIEILSQDCLLTESVLERLE
jgi:hypothetical protein